MVHGGFEIILNLCDKCFLNKKIAHILEDMS